VFDPSSTQDDVYADTQPLIRSVLDGALSLRWSRARWRVLSLCRVLCHNNTPPHPNPTSNNHQP